MTYLNTCLLLECFTVWYLINICVFRNSVCNCVYLEIQYVIVCISCIWVIHCVIFYFILFEYFNFNCVYLIKANILENSHLFTGKVQKNGICEVLYAAAWIVGEFSELVRFSVSP